MNPNSARMMAWARMNPNNRPLRWYRQCSDGHDEVRWLSTDTKCWHCGKETAPSEDGPVLGLFDDSYHDEEDADE